MNTYELVYIIPTTFTDEEIGGVETKINALVTKYGGNVTSTERLGKLRLAYAIDKQRHGHYVMVMFQSEPGNVAKIEENLRINTDILRHLIVRVEGEAGKYELVQFTEVDLNLKEDKKRKEKKEDKAEEGKEGEVKDEKAGEQTDAEKAEVIAKKVDEVLKADEKTA